MGHLINPISLRLGNTQVWRSQWYKSTNREYLSTMKEDFLLYNYIESFFKFAKLKKKRLNAIVKLNSKAKKKIRNRNKYLRPSQRKRIRIKRYTLSKLIEKLSLIFSHANVLRANINLFINLHIYDGAFETFKVKTQVTEYNKFSFTQLEKINFFKQQFDKKNEANFLINKNKNETRYKNKKKGFQKFKNKKFNLSLSNSKLYLRDFLFFHRKGLRRKKPYNVLPTFIRNRQYRYSPNIIKTDIDNIDSKKQIFNNFIESKIYTNHLLEKKNGININIKSKSKSLLNLELRFITTRLNYLAKYLILFFNPNAFDNKNMFKLKPKRNKKTKKIVYYFKLVKLLTLLHTKKVYKTKLQNIFLFRLLLHALLVLRMKIKFRLKNFLRSKIFLKKNKNKKSKKILNFKKPMKNINKVFTRQLSFDKNLSLKNRFKFKDKTKINSRLSSRLHVFKRNYLKLNKFLLYILCIGSQYTVETQRLELYKMRYKIWFYISRILFENVKTLIEQKNYSLIKFSYFGLTNLTPTAAMLVNYITNRLYQKYTIFEVLKPLSIDLSKNFTIDGFKISCAGRLTKKQRASLFVQQTKKVPANTFDSFIDYATSIVRLRHGVCGLKVWVTRKKTFKFFEYNFTYTYKLS